MDNAELLAWTERAFVQAEGDLEVQVKLVTPLAILLQTKMLLTMYEDWKYDAAKPSAPAAAPAKQVGRPVLRDPGQ